MSSLASAPTSYQVELLTEDEWRRLRDVRLSALQQSSRSFLANYEDEKEYDETRWRREFARGEWNVVLADDQVVGLLGATREPSMPLQECYLEYVWIESGLRQQGVGTMLLKTVLDRLRQSGLHTVWLWILDGNEAALRLYLGFGFQSTNERQPLQKDPARCEERMRLRLE